jgi:hypothetical protein
LSTLLLVAGAVAVVSVTAAHASPRPGTAPPTSPPAATDDTVVVDSIPEGGVVDTGPVDSSGGDDTGVGPQVSQPAGQPVGPAGASGAGSSPGALVIVPAGCASAPPAQAVFAGTVVTRRPDSARFRIEEVRDGSLDAQRLGDFVDVTYGDDARYLTVGKEYLVGVAPDAKTGQLTSKVREPVPLFGGDAVIGINDSDISCPRVEDPVRTLYADGSALDVGVLTPLHGSRGRVLKAILIPVAVALGLLLVLVAIKLLGQTAFRSAMASDDDVISRRRRRHSPF